MTGPDYGKSMPVDVADRLATILLETVCPRCGAPSPELVGGVCGDCHGRAADGRPAKPRQVTPTPAGEKRSVA